MKRGKTQHAMAASLPSCPDLFRASPAATPAGDCRNHVDGRDKPGHDGVEKAVPDLPHRQARNPLCPSCPDLFRAPTSRHRLFRARPTPRSRKTWMAGTSPAMTTGGLPPPRHRRPPDQVREPGMTVPPTSSCPDLFRVPTSLHRLFRSRPTPRCGKTWMPGTSPGMTVGGWVRRVRLREVMAGPERSGTCPKTRRTSETGR